MGVYSKTNSLRILERHLRKFSLCISKSAPIRKKESLLLSPTGNFWPESLDLHVLGFISHKRSSTQTPYMYNMYMYAGYVYCRMCTCRVRHVLLPLMMVVVSDPAGQRAHDVERMRILRMYMFATYALCLCTSRCCCFELVCTFGTLVHLLCAVCCTRCCLTAAASKVIHYDYTLYDRVARGKTSACACVSSTRTYSIACAAGAYSKLYTLYTLPSSTWFRGFAAFHYTHTRIR